MIEKKELQIPADYKSHLRVGTCSWKYDSWKGLIYQAGINYSPDSFLPDYTKYFNTVEVDQWFWSLFPGGIKLPDSKSVQTYADSVPDDFSFTVKAPNSITLTHFYKRQPKNYAEFADKPNDHFLDVRLLETFLQKLDPLVDCLGPIMFQFEYLNKQKMSSKEEFFDRLHDFFDAAPKGYKYAIETRNKNYLCDDFFEFLKDHELGFVFLDGYYMPPPSWVHENFNTITTDYSIMRLHGSDRSGIEKTTGKIWDKIVEPRDEGLQTAAKIVQDNKIHKVSTYVNVNNHYEGSAPRTIQKLLKLI